MEKMSICIYLTRGIFGGDERRQQLLLRFSELVHYDIEKYSVQFPRWSDLPFPLKVTCAISDNLFDDRTQKLLNQGVLVVHTQWMLDQIYERKLLVPIDAEKYKLRLQPQEHLKRPISLFHVKSSEVLGGVKGTSSTMIWTQPQDDIIRAIHRYRLAGDYDRARAFENLLIGGSGAVIVGNRLKRSNIQDREKQLFGFNASAIE
jgi:hypothetical protein